MFAVRVPVADIPLGAVVLRFTSVNGGYPEDIVAIPTASMYECVVQQRRLHHPHPHAQRSGPLPHLGHWPSIFGLPGQAGFLCIPCTRGASNGLRRNGCRCVFIWPITRCMPGLERVSLYTYVIIAVSFTLDRHLAPATVTVIQ